jgi:hypothetical protein
LGYLKALLLTVGGAILGLVATLTNHVWLAVLATVITLVGAYYQYRDAKPFEYIFSSANWQKDGAELNLVIPKKLHNKTNPTATVFKGLSPNFDEVDVDIKIKLGSTVVIGASLPFEGKVVIK